MTAKAFESLGERFGATSLWNSFAPTALATGSFAQVSQNILGLDDNEVELFNQNLQESNNGQEEQKELGPDYHRIQEFDSDEEEESKFTTHHLIPESHNQEDVMNGVPLRIHELDHGYRGSNEDWAVFETRRQQDLREAGLLEEMSVQQQLQLINQGIRDSKTPEEQQEDFNKRQREQEDANNLIKHINRDPTIPAKKKKIFSTKVKQGLKDGLKIGVISEGLNLLNQPINPVRVVNNMSHAYMNIKGHRQNEEGEIQKLTQQEQVDLAEAYNSLQSDSRFFVFFDNQGHLHRYIIKNDG